jgi:hypothetical protein
VVRARHADRADAPRLDGIPDPRERIRALAAGVPRIGVRAFAVWAVLSIVGGRILRCRGVADET